MLASSVAVVVGSEVVVEYSVENVDSVVDNVENVDEISEVVEVELSSMLPSELRNTPRPPTQHPES